MRELSKTGKLINSKVAKAIHDYDLISNGDKILVAVSGGKDSLTLLDLLTKIEGWAPVNFEIYAAYVETDFRCGGCAHTGTLATLFDKLGIGYRFKKAKVLDEEGKTNCFWCSWNRRKALFEIADELGCNKVALGHHKDDIVETTLLNLLYNGEFSSMNPRQELFKGKITLIRPLSYVDEKDIKAYAKENKFPKQLCKCPLSKDSKRKYVKDLIKQAQKNCPKINIKTNIFNSASRIRREYLDVKEENNARP